MKDTFKNNNEERGDISTGIIQGEGRGVIISWTDSNVPLPPLMGNRSVGGIGGLRKSLAKPNRVILQEESHQNLAKVQWYPMVSNAIYRWLLSISSAQTFTLNSRCLSTSSLGGLLGISHLTHLSKACPTSFPTSATKPAPIPSPVGGT